jgi:hypothetical protein
LAKKNSEATYVVPGTTGTVVLGSPVKRIKEHSISSSSTVSNCTECSVLPTRAFSMRPEPSEQHRVGVVSLTDRVCANVFGANVSDAYTLVSQTSDHVEHAGHEVSAGKRREN